MIALWPQKKICVCVCDPSSAQTRVSEKPAGFVVPAQNTGMMMKYQYCTDRYGSPHELFCIDEDLVEVIVLV